MSENENLVRNCNFKFKCTETWESLNHQKNATETIQDGNLVKRLCSNCDRYVYLVENQDQLLFALRDDNCIAISDQLMYPAGRPNNEPLMGRTHYTMGHALIKK